MGPESRFRWIRNEEEELLPQQSGSDPWDLWTLFVQIFVLTFDLEQKKRFLLWKYLKANAIRFVLRTESHTNWNGVLWIFPR
jgi:hypothetical protein